MIAKCNIARILLTFLAKNVKISLQFMLNEICSLMIFSARIIPDQGTKLFQYCTCPAGRVTYNFH